MFYVLNDLFQFQKLWHKIYSIFKKTVDRVKQGSVLLDYLAFRQYS